MIRDENPAFVVSVGTSHESLTGRSAIFVAAVSSVREVRAKTNAHSETKNTKAKENWEVLTLSRQQNIFVLNANSASVEG